MKAFIPLLPALLIFTPIAFVLEHPLAKFVWATGALLFLIKIGSVIRNNQLGMSGPRGLGWPIYLFAWPGMRPESFHQKALEQTITPREFVQGFIFFITGLLLQAYLIYEWESVHSTWRLYLGLISFLLIIHFGFSTMLYTFYRLWGWPVEKLFHSPFESDSLRDFWGKRWNLAFVDMDKRLFLPLFPRNIGKGVMVFGVFMVSGILHELGISYPAGGGWGMPFAYFMIHGLLTMIEPKLGLTNKFIRRIWVWGALLIPVPLLFHAPFLNAFIAPYFEFLHAWIMKYEIRQILLALILISGGGHFLILAASFQVPSKLGWKKEFAQLGRFNRKIFWTYGGYIVFCIVAFALVDLFNARGLLDNHPSSVVIAGFIALFWTVRVIVDFSYFKHDDWPVGDIFIVGHTCLTALFTFLALVHWIVVAWLLTT